MYPEHENGIFPNQKTVDLEQILRENDAVAHHRKKLIANYKTLRRWIIGYCFCVALLAVSWIVYIIVDIFVCQWKHHELIIFALLGSGLCIWGLGVIPIFKSFGKNNLKKAARFIDNIMCSFFDPSSKVSDYIIDVANEMIVLIINVILFWGCLQIRMPIFDLLQIESNLLAMTILLCVYQYAVIPVALLLVVNPLQKLGNKLMQRLGFNAPNPSKKYVKGILKNNTYLLFLLFHFIAKYYQADPASEAGITVTRIGMRKDELVALNQELLEDAQVYRDELDEDEFREIESDPTAYLLRRNFATHLAKLRLTDVQIWYVIGHKIEDPYVQRRAFNDEKLLFALKLKLDERPVLNPIMLERCVTLESGKTILIDTSKIVKIEIPVEPICKVKIHALAHEPGDDIRVRVTPSLSNGSITAEYSSHTVPMPEKPERTIDGTMVYLEKYQYYE